MIACLRILGMVFSLLVLLKTSAFAISGAGEILAGAGEDGKRIQLSPGQTLVVRLESNKTTGYSWAIAQLDGEALRSSGEPEYQAPDRGATPRLGAGGSQVFRFQAAKAGTSDLQLVYHRPWQKDTPPERTYHLTVVVTPDH